MDARTVVYANAAAGLLVVGNIVIGIQLFMVIYGFSVFLETPPSKRKGRLVYMIISLILFVLPTVASLVSFHRYFTVWRYTSVLLADPSARTPQLAWTAHVNNTLCYLTILLGDGLMLYRCYIIWADRLWVLIVPGLLFISSIVLSTLHLLSAMGLASSNIYSSLWVAFVSCSVSLIILVTALISGRLLNARWRIAQALGVPFSDPRARGNGNSTSALSILIESALPLALFGLVEAIIDRVFLDDNVKLYYIDAVFNGFYTSFAALSPQMIIFRVTTGRSWASHAGFHESLTPSKLNIGPILVIEDASNYRRASVAVQRDSDLESLCKIESDSYVEIEGDAPAKKVDLERVAGVEEEKKKKKKQNKAYCETRFTV